MNHFFRQLSASLIGSVFLLSVQAQEVKIGIVSLEQVLREAAPAKAAQVKLEQEAAKRQKELTELRVSLKAEADKFERDAPTLPESQKIGRQKQLMEKDRDIQRKTREFQEDMNARRNEELQQVIQRANKVIREIAVTEKFDVILQEAVYVNPKNDLTEKVIKALNLPAGK